MQKNEEKFKKMAENLLHKSENFIISVVSWPFSVGHESKAKIGDQTAKNCEKLKKNDKISFLEIFLQDK